MIIDIFLIAFMLSTLAGMIYVSDKTFNDVKAILYMIMGTLLFSVVSVYMCQ